MDALISAILILLGYALAGLTIIAAFEPLPRPF